MLNRRSEQIMMDLILQIAKSDHRVRAVIMNGSRANPNAKKDIFQDYDIMYIVNEVESFVADQDWINQFGDILILQTPDEMDGNWPKLNDKFAYLMQFMDSNRIDLTLLHVNKLPTMPRDSQSILLLDKDNLLKPFDLASDADYLPKPPTKKQFFDCCNEFLWVSTYVAKGIWRKEFLYAKHASEQLMKEELIKLLTWHAGIKTNHQKSIGKFSKHLDKYIEPEIWQLFTETYTDSNYTNMWKSLFTMLEIFNLIALKVSSHYGYTFNQYEYNDVSEYLHTIASYS